MATSLTDLADLRTRAGANKYGAEPTEVDGIRFASKAEARRYQELRILERAGQITDLRLQPRYELQPAFVDNKGMKRASIQYTADFAFREPGNPREVILEVKGALTRDYLVRARLFLYQHPELEFRVERA